MNVHPLICMDRQPSEMLLTLYVSQRLAELIDNTEPDVGSEEAFSDLKVKDAMRQLWDDSGVQKAVARGHEFALHDNLH